MKFTTKNNIYKFRFGWPWLIITQTVPPVTNPPAQEKTTSIEFVTLEAAIARGFKVKHNKEFNNWKDYTNQQLVIIRNFDKKGQLSLFMDLCYLSEGRGLGIKIPGKEVTEDVYRYLTTIKAKE